MLLLLMPLCLGLTSGGRLSECLLSGQTSPAVPPADPSVPTPDAQPAVPAASPGPDTIPAAAPDIVPAAAPELVPAAAPELVPGPVNPLLFGLPAQVPLLPTSLPVPISAPVPAAASALSPAEEESRRASFFSALPFSGAVSVGSFSSVGSYQGPQGGFFQFASPSPGLQVGYSGAHHSPPVVVCLNWCLDPTGKYSCCRYTGGQCPAVPDVCPANSQPTRLPTCAGDLACGFSFKCCFDRCQEQFVCKAAVV